MADRLQIVRVGMAMLLLCASRGLAAEPAPQTREVERLAALGRLWGTVRYLHPHLTRASVDWDRALVDAIPAVRTADTSEQYAAAVDRMLAVLGDADTRVRRVAPAAPLPATNAAISRVGNVLVASLRSLRRDEERAALSKELAAARAVVLDLRVGSPFESEYVEQALGAVQELLPSRAAPPLPLRRLQYLGYTFDFSSAQFAIQNRPGLAARKGALNRRVILLVNGAGELPDPLPSLIADGQAQLVVDGDACGATLDSMPVPLGETLEACVRIEEIADGRTLDATRVPAAKQGNAALTRALELAQTPAPRPRRVTAVPGGTMQAERPYREMKRPSVEYRLLALFRYWNVVRWFDPHTDKFDHPWDEQLVRFIPKMIAAESERDYVFALAELATYTDDSHAFVQSPLVWELKGNAAPPVVTALVEGQLAIFACLDASACKKAGVTPGDVVVSVDGKPAQERFRVLRAIATGSNAEHRDYLAALHLLWGPEKSTARIELRDGAGRLKNVALERSGANQDRTADLAHPGEVYRVLPGNIGYIDLERLQLEQIEPALAKIRDTAVTILDLRGYPHGRIWDLVGRLNARRASIGAIVRQPTLGLASEGDPLVASPRFEFAQRVPPSKGAIYAGKTIMLVDTRTQSQAEHLAVHLEAASGTTFVGSRTSGADGMMIFFQLPGGVVTGVTGTETRHADGRPIQRVGIVPTIEARPTLSGLRAGRDEVLERAVRAAAELGGKVTSR
jgi:C-terminal processing protease CtpA/Prc